MSKKPADQSDPSGGKPKKGRAAPKSSKPPIPRTTSGSKSGSKKRQPPPPRADKKVPPAALQKGRRRKRKVLVIELLVKQLRRKRGRFALFADVESAVSSNNRQRQRQLQKLLREFLRIFPSEEAAVDYAFRQFLHLGILKCKKCGSQSVVHCQRRKYRCNGCSYVGWFTANTFLHRVRKIRPYLAAMWFKERININASEFHWLFGRSYSNAWAILSKVRTAQRHHLPESMLKLPSVLFKDSFCKRSTETPRRSHPQSEEDGCSEPGSSDANEHHNQRSSPNVVPDPDPTCLSENQKNVYQYILDEPISVDRLCHLSGLAVGEISAILIELLLDGLIKESAGQRFTRVQNCANRISDFGENEQNAVQAHVEFMRFMHNYGVSRKYVQNYLSDFVLHAQRENWAGGILTDICLRFRHVGIDEIMAYVTPTIVQVLPVPLAATN